MQVQLSKMPSRKLQRFEAVKTYLSVAKTEVNRDIYSDTDTLVTRAKLVSFLVCKHLVTIAFCEEWLENSLVTLFSCDGSYMLVQVLPYIAVHSYRYTLHFAKFTISHCFLLSVWEPLKLSRCSLSICHCFVCATGHKPVTHFQTGSVSDLVISTPSSTNSTPATGILIISPQYLRA